MKVLFNTYPIAFDCPGGGEIQLIKTQQALVEQNHEVLFYNQWKPQLHEAEVIHYFSVFGGSSVFCGYVKQLGKKLAVSPILYPHRDLEKYPMPEIISVLNMADLILPNSHIEAELLSKVCNIPIEKFHVVYNGIDASFMTDPAFDESLFRKKFDVQGKYLLCVGNIENRKNQLQLARALKNTDHQLILLGNIRDQNYFNEMMAASNQKIKYLGHLPHDSDLLRSAYLGCEAFVLPSLLETPGLAALEAAALGSKVLVTQVGSTTEYFENLAVYVDPDSNESILNGIHKILTTPKNDQLKEHVRSKFSWKNTALQTLAAYQKIKNQ